MWDVRERKVSRMPLGATVLRGSGESAGFGFGEKFCVTLQRGSPPPQKKQGSSSSGRCRERVAVTTNLNEKQG